MVRRLACLVMRPLTAGVITLCAIPAAAGNRLPLWPTELPRVAAPLAAPDDYSEAERQLAVGQLAEYASARILPYVDAALRDPAVSVRRAALELCLLRQLDRCGRTAEEMWRTGDQESLRTTALAVLALDPREDRAELLIAALRDDSELMRAHAALLVGQAPFDDTWSLRARRELMTKLVDAAPRVRRSAALSLGRLGPGEGALALVRLLEDPDLAVREAAAEALGGLADPRSAPPLRRVLENPPSDQVAQRALASLAGLADASIDLDLLEYLDAPPAGLSRAQVADAIGRRRDVSDALVDGLVARLHEPELRDDALRALRWQGDRPMAALQRALAHGLPPSLRLEVERLIAARRVDGRQEEVAADPRWPAPDDRKGWMEALAGTDAAGAATALAARAPPWVKGALRRSIRVATSGEEVRGWLFFLALANEDVLDAPDDAATWTRVTRWASDRTLGAGERCHAAWALGAAAHTRYGADARDSLRVLAGDASALLRACAATGLAAYRADTTLEALLVDEDPRVRGAAALSVRRVGDPSSGLRSRLALVAAADGDPRVRALARLACTRPASHAQSSPWVVEQPSDLPWLPIVIGGVAVEVPAAAGARHSAVLVTGVDVALRRVPRDEPPAIQPVVEIIFQGLQ